MWFTIVLFPDPDGAENINTLLSMWLKALLFHKNNYFCDNQSMIVLTLQVLARKKKHVPAVDPDIFQKSREALRRRHRQVIYLNDSELAAVKEYCDRFGIKARSAIFREATMEMVLSQLSDSHPTLF